MGFRGQGAFEYLLLLGGTVLISVLVILVMSTGTSGANNSFNESRGEYSTFISKGIKNAIAAGGGGPSCPANWIFVPGNVAYGVSTFCVMRYEARQDANGKPVSQSAGSPWVSISQSNAKAKCASLGEDYHLITDYEWMAIATDASGVSGNWFNSDGQMMLKVGNTGYVLAGVSYDGPDTGEGDDVLAQLVLSNGQVVSHLSGNMKEWTDATITSSGNCDGGMPTTSGTCLNVPNEWVYVTDYKDLEYMRPPSLWAEEYDAGKGRVFLDNDAAQPSGSVRGFIRGGYFAYGFYSGVFALELDHAPEYTSTAVSFRCARS